MSGSEPETVAGKIEALRRTIPPPAGRQSRRDYISKDDLAELLEVSRSAVIRWTNGQGYPDERNRVRLAELSGGRYRPEDFQPASRTVEEMGSLERRMAAVERAVAAIERQLFGSDGLLSP